MHPAKLAARALAEVGFTRPLVGVYARTVTAMPPIPAPGRGIPTLLALNPGRFRGELEPLAQTGRVRILRLPFEWQCRLGMLFYPEKKVPLQWHFSPDLDSGFARRQEKQRRFLRTVLPSLFERLGVDGVISSASHYREDYEIGSIAEELGYPYIVLQRENIIGPIPAARARYIDRLGRQGRFRGRQILVHDNETRAAFIDSGFARSDQVSTVGCMRMDILADRVAREIPQPRARKRVTFFSFSHGTALLGTFGFNAFAPNRDQGFVRLFEATHVAFAKLALARPDVDFVIRPKWRTSWTAEIDRVLESAGLRIADIPNLSIDAESDAHDVVFASDVVCCFASTTIFEAGIAGRPVVIPYFHEVAKYESFLHPEDILAGVADVARAPEEFSRLVEARLEEPGITPALMERRRAAFSRFISDLSSRATDRYADKLTELVPPHRRATPQASA